MLQSRNPVLGRAGVEYRQEGYSATSGGPGQAPPPTAAQLAEMYHQPALIRPTTVMTLNDVMVKSGLLFVILLAGAVVGWLTAPMFLWVGGMVVGLVLGLVNAFKREVSPVLVVLYALAEGVFLGGISAFYQAFGEANGMGNLVLTAVVATFAVVGVMLALYRSGVIKVTPRFQRILMGAIVGYVVFAFVNMLGAWIFGLGGGMGVFGMGWIGILLSVFVVGLAAFTLTMDFEMIKQYCAMGVPERESWRMSFGLLVTIIWLYLEILRLLAIISAGRD